MNRPIIFLTALVLLLLKSSFAGEFSPDPQHRYSLEELREIARRDNPGLRLARLDQLLDRYDRLTALGNFLPGINSSVSFQQSLDLEGYISGSTFKRLPRSSYYSLSVSLPLFAGGDHLLQWFSTHHEIQRRRLAEKDARADLDYQVASAYYLVLAAEDYLEMARSFLKEQEEQFQRTRELFSLGAVIYIDTLQAALDVSDRRREVISAETSLQLQRSNLNVLLDIPLETVLQLQPASAGSPPAFGSPDSLFKAAVAHNPRLALQREAGTLARIGRWRALTPFFPSTRFSYSLNWSQEMTAEESFLLKPDPHPDRFVGVQLNWPLFQGFQRLQNRERARVEELRQKEQYHQALVGKEQEIRRLLGELRQSRQEYTIHQGNLELARHNLDKTRELYRLKRVTLLEVRSAESQFLKAQVDTIKSRYDLLILAAELRMAVGG
jgi:outer membrane protein